MLEDPEMRCRPLVSVLSVINRKRFIIVVDFPLGTKPNAFLQERFREQLMQPRPYAFDGGSNIAIYPADQPKQNTTYSIALEQALVKSLPPEIDDLLPQRMNVPIDDE